MILPPYPFSLEDPSDMSLDGAWHARPQLFFKCILRPEEKHLKDSEEWASSMLACIAPDS